MNVISTWVVIGGRRWSRIVTEELCSLLDPTQPVTFQAVSPDAQMLEWQRKNPYRDCVNLVETLDVCPPPNIGVALVFNSAYLHYSSIEDALNKGYNVVCEKPMTFSRLETAKLLEKAQALGLHIFSTNTYIFADYLRIFGQEWLSSRKYSHIHIDWMDAAIESRYGERKVYDSSVPIIYDVLPHIASIIMIFHGKALLHSSTIQVLKGGSEVNLTFGYGGLKITANLVRNSTQRKRLIRFYEKKSEVAIDFTQEPGTVSINGGDVGLSDPNWHSKRKPIADMLFSVKRYFEEGREDERLSYDVALFSNELIDSVAQEYVDQQIIFLNSTHELGVEGCADFAYAKKESTSLRTRVMPYLAQGSFLEQLAMAAQ